MKRRNEVSFQRCDLCGRVRMPGEAEWHSRDYCPKCYAWMHKPSAIENVPKDIFRKDVPNKKNNWRSI